MATQHPKNPNKLWIARKKAGLGQKSVARLLGYKSISSISEYESGKVLPSLTTALKLAVVYNTPLADLYDSLHDQIADEIASAKSKMPSRISVLHRCMNTYDVPNTNA